jgi:hypothetical protein
LIGQHLQRDIASEPRVARAVYLAHSTHTEGGEDLVCAEVSAGGEGHSNCDGLYRRAPPSDIQPQR